MKCKRTRIITSVASLFLLLIAFLLIKPLLSLPMPNPQKATVREIGQYISGKNFREISPTERRRFMVEIKKKGQKPENIAAALQEREKVNFRRNMEFFKQERLKEFFLMSPEEQQGALKEAANEMKEMKENENIHPTTGYAPSHKKNLEGESPEDRARSIEFARRVKSYVDNAKIKR